jgi:hypothetical protein
MIGTAALRRLGWHVWLRLFPARPLALPSPTPTYEDGMPSARINRMITAGRRHLRGNPAMPANDYSVKQVMKVAVSDYSAQEQMEAIGELKIEFQKRQPKVKA